MSAVLNQVGVCDLSANEVAELRAVADRAKAEDWIEGVQLHRLLDAYEQQAEVDEHLRTSRAKTVAALEEIEGELDSLRDDLRHYVSDLADVAAEKDEGERDSLSACLERRLSSVVGAIETLSASATKTRKEFEDDE